MALNYEGGWNSQNPVRPRAHASSRYYPPHDDDQTNHFNLEIPASRAFKDENVYQKNADTIERIQERRQGLTDYPIIKDKVFCSLVTMGGVYIIVRNGFNFSPAMGMIIGGISGLAYYHKSDLYSLQKTFDKLKN